MQRHRSRLLVVLQFVGALVCCLPTGWPPAGSWWWVVPLGLGIALGLSTLWANRPGNFAIHPEPKTTTRLITHGPYRWIRHPMYVAFLLSLAGVAGVNGHWLNLAGWLLLPPVVVAKALTEERHLQARFPAYADYVRRSARFLPGIW